MTSVDFFTPVFRETDQLYQEMVNQANGLFWLGSTYIYIQSKGYTTLYEDVEQSWTEIVVKIALIFTGIIPLIALVIKAFDYFANPYQIDENEFKTPKKTHYSQSLEPLTDITPRKTPKNSFLKTYVQTPEVDRAALFKEMAPMTEDLVIDSGTVLKIQEMLPDLLEAKPLKGVSYLPTKTPELLLFSFEGYDVCINKNLFMEGSLPSTPFTNNQADIKYLFFYHGILRQICLEYELDRVAIPRASQIDLTFKDTSFKGIVFEKMKTQSKKSYEILNDETLCKQLATLIYLTGYFGLIPTKDELLCTEEGKLALTNYQFVHNQQFGLLGFTSQSKTFPGLIRLIGKDQFLRVIEAIKNEFAFPGNYEGLIAQEFMRVERERSLSRK